MQVARNSRHLAAARRGRLARRRREGNIAIMVVLLIGVIFGFASLAVDASQLYKVRTEGQNAADATALAAALRIDGTSTGITASRELAVRFAPENRMYAGGAVAADTNVTFGRWSPATGVFTSMADTEVTQINAVRVQLTPANVHNPFAVLQGRAQTNVGAYAIAANGGSASKCTSPMVVGDCGAGITNAGNRCLTMGTATTDTAGWSGFSRGSSDQDFARLLYDGCRNLIPGCAGWDSTGTLCAGTCNSTNTTTVDGDIPTFNGNSFNEGGVAYGDCPTVGTGGSALSHPCHVLKQILLRQTNPDASTDPADLVSVSLGGTPTNVLRSTYFTIKVPMIHGTVSGGFCSPDYNNSGEDVTGYATVDVFGVKCSASPMVRAAVDADYLTRHGGTLTTLGCNPPSGKFILARMYLEEDSGAGGGGNPGNSSAHPRLVE